MIQRILTACLLAALPVAAFAAELSDAELEGRQLVRELLEQTPAESSTLTGILKIRDGKGKRSEIPVQCVVILGETDWQTIYETLPGTNSITEKLTVIHNSTNASRYALNGAAVSGAQTAVRFAGSDFSLADLGLQFLHWSAQKVLKKELRRSRSCTVLESTNPEPAPQGYSRVVSWIDRESSGIVHADAYDASGKKMKEFEPKEFKKVHGQWQLQEMQIRNTQTGSRTQLEFNLDPK